MSRKYLLRSLADGGMVVNFGLTGVIIFVVVRSMLAVRAIARSELLALFKAVGVLAGAWDFGHPAAFGACVV